MCGRKMRQNLAPSPASKIYATPSGSGLTTRICFYFWKFVVTNSRVEIKTTFKKQFFTQKFFSDRFFKK
jgi:hypothetical protein